MNDIGARERVATKAVAHVHMKSGEFQVCLIILFCFGTVPK
jgi:hypothetical protein